MSYVSDFMNMNVVPIVLKLMSTASHFIKNIKRSAYSNFLHNIHMPGYVFCGMYTQPTSWRELEHWLRYSLKVILVDTGYSKAYHHVGSNISPCLIVTRENIVTNWWDESFGKTLNSTLVAIFKLRCFYCLFLSKRRKKVSQV